MYRTQKFHPWIYSSMLKFGRGENNAKWYKIANDGIG